MAQHQTFEYRADEPFIIYNVTPGTTEKNRHRLLEHWHEELEMAYVLAGHSTHYVDGQRIVADPGRLVIINSGSVHSIIPDTVTPRPGEIATIVLLIHRQFLRDNFPQYRTLRFTNDQPLARPEIGRIMRELSAYEARQPRTGFDALYIRGLLLQLLYYMCLEGTAPQKALPGDDQRKKFKEILVYIETHFEEPLSQAELAARFHFSSGYFSRYFKQHTGITFMQYLTQLRLQKAKSDLIATDRTVSQVALRHGFADERSFINAFKKSYFTTPLQYRKQYYDKN